MSSPEDPKGKPSPKGMPSAGRSASARSIGEELGDLDFEPDALLDSLLSDEPRPVQPTAQPAAATPAPAPPVAPAAPPRASAEPAAPEPPKLFEPDSREWPADEVTLSARIEVPEPSAPPIVTSPPPSSDGLDAVDDLLSEAPPAAAPPGSAAPPVAPRMEAPPPPRAPRPAPPRPGAPPRPEAARRPEPPPPAPEPPRAASVEDLDADEFSELPPSIDPGDADIDALVGNLDGVAAEAPEISSFPEEEPVTAVPARMSGPEILATEADLSAEEQSAALAAAAEGDGAAAAEGAGFEPLYTPENWEADRPAAVHLAEQQALEQWRERAAWLEGEAQHAADALAKARTLLVASELWAMAGDANHARKVAASALALAPTLPLAQRQARLLAAQDRDYKSVAQALDIEAKSSANPDVRCHAVYVGAEIARFIAKDATQTERRLEVLHKLDPKDPRRSVMKLGLELSQGDRVPSKDPSLTGELAPLAAAVAELASLRSDAPLEAGQGGPAQAFERARRALERGDRAGAGRATRELAVLPGFEKGALWLAHALLATDQKTRSEAIEVLRQLAAEEQSPALTRALSARALEAGDPQAIASLLEAPTASASGLSDADLVSLAALTGGGRALVQRWLHALESDPRLSPLASAAASASSPADGPATLVSGEEASRAAVALGRALVAAQAENAEPGLLRSTAEAYSIAHADDPLVPVLEAELALQAGAAFRVANVVAGWGGDGDDVPERDRRLAAGLIHEIGQDPDSAAREYAAALRADPGSEAAARALSENAPPNAAADLLVGLADAVEDEAHKALLLVESALRLGFDSSDFGPLLEKAAELAPGLPFAHRLGKQHARLRGHAGDLLAWLDRRRESADDAMEKAFDAIRQAWLVADSDGERAAELLASAVSARPDDVGLRELYERMSPAGGAARGAWREEVAGSESGAEKTRLLLEAALEFERADDLAAAARAAHAAAAAGASAFARVTADRLAPHGAAGAELAAQLLADAKAAADPAAQRELYERLSELDRARGDASSALLWQSAILEANPKHLPALRAIEHAYLGSGRADELEPVAATLAGLLDRNEATAHAILAARLRIKAGARDRVRELAELAAAHDPPSLWALRTLSVAARESHDDTVALRTNKALSERVARAIDASTLALRAAEAALRMGELGEAKSLLDRAVELVPDHWVALRRQADALERLGESRGAAEALEALAGASKVEAHQLDAWHRAAVLWLDKVGDAERGQVALEAAASLDLKHADVFSRLRALYVQREEREKLAELLERRIDLTDDPEERVALEVTRGKALADIGDRDAARQALAAALDANPDHADALDAFAELAVHDGDWEGAEQAWIRLARHATEPERQAEIYRKLGALYENQLPNAQRAELSYREVLKRIPNDVGAMERLVYVHGALGDSQKAIELQTELLNRAGTPDEKRDRTIELARVQEEILKDRRKAEGTLDKARKTWPQDGAVLRALAEFYRRGGEATALNVLLDRAANDARRALGTGRFDASLFEALATVAELRGGTDAARVANATLAALNGTEPDLPGAGLAAGDARLDDLLAPELLTLPLRALLKKVGDPLDAAYALDLRSIRATPLPAEAVGFAQQIQQMATAFGVHNVEVYVSSALGPVCAPASSAPPRLVFGSSLLDKSADDAARTFLVLRSLKLLQSRTAALSRAAPIDLWPMVAGLLSVFAPSWAPPGVDAKKVAEHQQRFKSALVRQFDDDVPVLALEVIGSIGNRASQLGTAVNQWGNRTGLLALGSPATALLGVAVASGHPEGLPSDPAERLKWIVRNPEARDLAVFSVSEQYADARRRLGLAG